MRRRLLVLGFGAALLGACAEIKPADFTANDDCADCPPGLLSGDDGVLTIGIPVGKGEAVDRESGEESEAE